MILIDHLLKWSRRDFSLALPGTYPLKKEVRTLLPGSNPNSILNKKAIRKGMAFLFKVEPEAL